MQGARAVQKSIIEDFPNADISVSIVWIDMLPSDTELTAKRSARIIDDPRVRHFYDPGKRSGKAITQSLGWEGKMAWDVYLFYTEGTEWVEDPPMPSDWLHQLNDSWADRVHFHSGNDLVEELYKTMQKLTDISPSGSN